LTHPKTNSVAIVREACHADIGNIVAMYEWLFAPPGSRPALWSPDLAAERLGRAISSDAAVVFIAGSKGKLVGFLTAYEDIESVRFGRRVWVEDLAVHPAHRSRGIGKELLVTAKRWALGRGASRLQLDSSGARTDAHRFYERERPSFRSFCFGWFLIL
jgi:GNAT superfamily N-acetyltransferase